jgi:ER membrane protein complex subunit 7
MIIVSPLSILKNPMILIAGFSLLVVFGMPYLVDNSKPSFYPSFLSSLLQ